MQIPGANLRHFTGHLQNSVKQDPSLNLLDLHRKQALKLLLADLLFLN